MPPPDRTPPSATPAKRPAAVSPPGRSGGPTADPASTPPTDALHQAQQATLPFQEGAPLPGNQSLVGYRFDDFELLAELGRGGMGVVYKAVQQSLDRVVAVKLLLAEHCHNASVLARFQAEARAAAVLGHPNIVGVYQVGQCPVGPYFVMEFIDGQTLETLCAKKPVPIPWAVSLLITVCDAIHFAHSKGTIHRDLKPANIMIDRFRRPVVMDFGIAKVAGRPGSVTQQGTVIGTPGYIPPEQAGEDSSQVGPHSDVYSLGAILYTLLTGRLPYEDENPLKALLMVLAPKPPSPVRSLRPEVPVALERICMKCLRKRPGDRYGTAQALGEDLRRFRAGPAAKAGPSTKRAAVPSLLLVAETGKKVRLFPGTTVLGRGSDCDIVLRAADISKRHCQITLQPGQASIEDLDSANGTYVNGEPIERCELRDGDRVSIAEHTFRVRFDFDKPKA